MRSLLFLFRVSVVVPSLNRLPEAFFGVPDPTTSCSLSFLCGRASLPLRSLALLISPGLPLFLPDYPQTIAEQFHLLIFGASSSLTSLL